jgi:hypothetical protein
LKARAFAVAVAVVLVVGAFFVRRDVIEGDDDNGNGTDPTEELVCITELADVCETYAAGDGSLQVTIEDAGVTLDRLASLGDDEAAPLWLTVEPYPAMVDSIRTGARAEPFGFTTTVLGASQLGVALPPDGRLDVLIAACGTQPLWRCIGADAGAPWTEVGGEARWGTIRPAFGDVNDSALALASFASSVAGYFGDTEISRSRWEADTAAFTPWVRGLASTASGVSLSGGSALGTMATRPSALDIAATAGFELATVDANAERFASNYPAPEMWLQAVLAAPGGAAAPGDLASDLTEQLGGFGWDDAATATAALPNAATMLALRAYWQDAT